MKPTTSPATTNPKPPKSITASHNEKGDCQKKLAAA
jgi:hypothetical protein